MRLELKRLGNSTGVILPKEFGTEKVLFGLSKFALFNALNISILNPTLKKQRQKSASNAFSRRTRRLPPETTSLHRRKSKRVSTKILFTR